MTVTLAQFRPEIAALIQNNTLQRVFQEALFPRLLFRSTATPERWEANAGETKIFTRAGRIPVNVKPLIPGQDPTPKTYATEQFRVTANQYADRIQTHMPTARAALPGKFLLDVQALAVNAGETLDRLTRDALFVPYLSGDTVLVAAASSGARELSVASLNGFLETVLVGVLQTVNPGAPIAIELGPTATPNFVIGARPALADDPYGPGTITLQNPLGTGLSVRARVRALHRARIVRAGGGATVDNITATNTLKMSDIIGAIQMLRAQHVPAHADGRYHVHIPVEGITQIFADDDFKKMNTGILPTQANSPYADLVIGNMLGSTFWQNTENPNQLNTGILVGTGNNALMSPEIGAEVVNETGVPIARTIITGGGALYEEYIPESEYGTEAGYAGKVGTFNVTANGVEVNTDRIRYILRQPQDVLQQVVDHAWSWSGGFASPSDLMSGSGARYKRAVVIEHAG
jgi:hypothetical protein